MARIHDKFVIELREVIKGYGNDYRVIEPCNLPCDYKFYEIPGIAICEKSFKRMKPLNDYMDWIPCSEREPEEYGEYFVTWTTSMQRKPLVAILECDVTNEWDDEKHRFKVNWLLEEYMKAYPDVKVVAWRELPDAWEGGWK
jgi:hypothetical protein